MKRAPYVLKCGSTLENGRYVIGSLIGRGGFGITYLAYDTALDRRIALKEYYPKGIALRDTDNHTVSAADESDEQVFKEGARRFYEEAELVSHCNGNPNIVNVHEFFRENDTVYFTMGYLSGETLKTYINRKGRITEGQAVKVLDRITDALLITHSMNLLHRDISPDNIMLCDDGTVKLIDFGAARQISHDESQSFSVILKQNFAPLEQYQRKGNQGPWTDIYALGATIYNAVTGELPEDANTRLVNDEKMKGSSHLFSHELWIIIEKSMMLRAEERIQSIVELKEYLNALKTKIKEEPFDDLLIHGIRESNKTVSKKKSDDSGETELLDDEDGYETVLERSGKKHKKEKDDPGETELLTDKDDYETFLEGSGKKYKKNEADGEKTDDKETINPPHDGSAVEDQKNRKRVRFVLRIIGIPIVAVSVISLIFFVYIIISVFRTSGRCGNDARWKVENETLTITGEGNMENYGALENRAPWSYGNTGNIKRVIIEPGITNISEYAFYDIKNLEEVTIPVGITEIGKGAFGSCVSLKELNLPLEVKKIGSGAFLFSGITDIYYNGSSQEWEEIQKESAEDFYMIIVHYSDEENGSDDEKVAMDLDTAVTSDSASDAMSIAWKYYSGDGVDQDYSEAMKWFIKAAEKGDPSAYREIGNMYFRAYGVEQDYDKAIEWFQKAADLGNSSAENDIGYMYKHGYGVEQDYEKAVEYYTRSAEQGNAAGQYNLSCMYLHGNGVEQDYDKALLWSLKSAEQGNTNAHVQIGNMYYKGEGVEKDYNKALEWYLKAAATDDDPVLEYNIGNVYSTEKYEDRDYKKAMEWYLKAAQKGHAKSMLEIAELYENGLGVEKNIEKASEWRAKASESGEDSE